MLVALSSLKPGTKAEIKKIIDSPTALKLQEMGCMPGTEIELKRIAPLGDPICIRVNGYVLSIRKSDAQLLQVEVLS